MEIRPIISSLLRNKTGALLIVYSNAAVAISEPSSVTLIVTS